MSSLTLSVGFDYHDELIRVCVMNAEGRTLVNRSVCNDIEAVVDLVSSYGSQAMCAVEACCGAADFAEQLRLGTGWDVRLAHPGYVRRLKQSPDKSDHDDAPRRRRDSFLTRVASTIVGVAQPRPGLQLHWQNARWG